MALRVATPAPRRGASAALRLLSLGLVSAAVARWSAGTCMPSVRMRPLTPDMTPFQPAKPFLPNMPAQPGTESPKSIWRCGDRVRAVAPINKTNGGRGFYNEGAAEMVSKYQVDEDEDEREFRALSKVIEGGTEGTVVSVFKQDQWAWPYHRPQHWRGYARPWVLVDFDGADNAIEACEEWDLEINGDDFRAAFENNKPLYAKYGSMNYLKKALRKARVVEQHGNDKAKYWTPDQDEDPANLYNYQG